MFSPYRMRCPKCKTPVTIKKESYIGRKVTCKECSTKFVIKPAGKKSAKSKKPQAKKNKNKTGQDSEFMLALDRLDLNDESQSIKSLPQAPGRKSKVRRVEETIARKIKEKKPKKTDAISPVAMIIGVLITALFVGGIGYLAKGNLPSFALSKFEPPKSFKWYTEKHNILSMKMPEGWDIRSDGGRHGKELWIRTEKDSIVIEIRDDVKGSAANLFFSGSQTPRENAPEIPDNLKPISKLHKFNLEKAQELFEGYEEDAPRIIDSAMGHACMADFHYSTMFSGKVSGIRVTYRTFRYQLTLYCTCPEKNFREMKSAFMKIATSVTAGAVSEL